MNKFFLTHNKKITILLITAIFLVPMMTAWLSFAKGWFLSSNKTQHGILIAPPLAIGDLALTDATGQAVDSQLKGKWWLIYLTADLTKPLTKQNLYNIRQIRQATGKDIERIERGVITTATASNVDTWLTKHYPGTLHFIISNTKLAELELNLPKKLDLLQGSIYLVDPLGNIMLYYAPDAAPKDILKDLKKVLKVSQIG